MNFLFFLNHCSNKDLDILISSTKNCIKLKQFLNKGTNFLEEEYLEILNMEYIGMLKLHHKFKIEEWEFILTLLQEMKTTRNPVGNKAAQIGIN